MQLLPLRQDNRHCVPPILILIVFHQETAPFVPRKIISHAEAMLPYRSSLSPPPCILLSLTLWAHIACCCSVVKFHQLPMRPINVISSIRPFPPRMCIHLRSPAVRPVFDSKDCQTVILGLGENLAADIDRKILTPGHPIMQFPLFRKSESHCTLHRIMSDAVCKSKRAFSQSTSPIQHYSRI
ncbi:hypothetical protein F5146DRAFT_302416 [Armillaria mellea]|nr:hypothetical protein F5146DRAFT_302416 [Armillaria mellea]